jgi:hypothetical protein
MTPVRDDVFACPRCGCALHRRKPASYTRTWALLIAAFLMYIPANLLPIMRTASLNDIDDNTILSGVVELWVKGSPDLAVIVFTASIVVPMLKFLVLGTLLVSSQRGSRLGTAAARKALSTGGIDRLLVDAGCVRGVFVDGAGAFQPAEPGRTVARRDLFRPDRGIDHVGLDEFRPSFDLGWQGYQ